MHMGMSLGMSMWQIQRCTVCEESVEEHRVDCPYKLMADVAKRQRHINCPQCYKPTIDVNTDDFFECRECHKQFTASLLGGEKLPETILLDYEQDEIINVRVMKEKGKGRYPLDQRLKELERIIKNHQRKISRKKKKL